MHKSRWKHAHTDFYFEENVKNICSIGEDIVAANLSILCESTRNVGHFVISAHLNLQILAYLF